MIGESPTRPWRLLVMPPVEVAAARSPLASSATAPTVPCDTSGIRSETLVPCCSHASCRRRSSVRSCRLGTRGKFSSSANSSAPSPTRSTWRDFSITRRARSTGFLTWRTAATAPAFCRAPLMTAASSSTQPSRVRAAPRPALKSGSSSSMRTAVVTASRLAPPRSRIAKPPSSARARLAWYSATRALETSSRGIAPAPPCMAIACMALDAVAQRQIRISELVDIRPGARGDEPARGHLVLGAVHRVDRDELAAGKITGAETARGRRAAHHERVVAVVEAHDDELQIVLIGPEPRDLVVRDGAAEHAERGARALFEGVVDGLEPHAPRIMRTRMQAAIAGGEDSRVGGAAELIDRDAIGAVKAGGTGQLIGGRNADANDHKIRRVLGSVLAQHRVCAAARGVLGDGAHARVAADPDTVARMFRLHERGHLRAGHAIHGAIGHLEYGDLQAKLAAGRRDFKSDVAAADDHNPPAGCKLGANGLDVAQCAQEIHTGKLRARCRQRPGPAAGCEEQLIVSMRRAVIDAHALRGAFDMRHAVREVRFDRMLRVEVRRGGGEPLRRERAREVLLRKGWTLIGPRILLTQQNDRARAALAAQGLNGGGGGLAGADNDDSRARHGWRIAGRTVAHQA